MHKENETIEARVKYDVQCERNRQHVLSHGGDTDEFDKTNSQNDWIAYITAYAGRAAQRVAKNERDGETFKKNMIKVAALAQAALEAHYKNWC